MIVIDLTGDSDGEVGSALPQVAPAPVATGPVPMTTTRPSPVSRQSPPPFPGYVDFTDDEEDTPPSVPSPPEVIDLTGNEEAEERDMPPGFIDFTDDDDDDDDSADGRLGFADEPPDLGELLAAELRQQKRQKLLVEEHEKRERERDTESGLYEVYAAVERLREMDRAQEEQQL